MSERAQVREAAVLAAIEDLFAIFAAYPLQPVVHGCPHCITEHDNALLHSRPLRRLTWVELERYAFKALTTWGSVEDFKHFLPRLFELIAGEEESVIDSEVLVGKLAVGQWASWPAAEQGAIRSFLMAWWIKTIHARVDPSEFELDGGVPWSHGGTPADHVLCCISRAEADVGPYLQAWLDAQGVEPSYHLAVFIWGNLAAIQKGRTTDSACPEQPQMEQVIAWLLKADTAKHLEKAAERYWDSPYVILILQASEQLDSLRQTFPPKARP